MLRAFKQFIDDDSDPLMSTDINPDSLHPTRLKSDDLVMVMAPTALAAQNVRGDTVHACIQYPRTYGNEKRLDPSSLEHKTESNKYGFSADSKKKLERRHRYKHFYFIDESGMVGAEMMAVIAKRLQQGELCHGWECRIWWKKRHSFRPPRTAQPHRRQTCIS